MSLGEVFEVSKASSHSQHTLLLDFYSQDVIVQLPTSGTTIPMLNYHKLQLSETVIPNNFSSVITFFTVLYHSNRKLIIKYWG